LAEKCRPAARQTDRSRSAKKAAQIRKRRAVSRRQSRPAKPAAMTMIRPSGGDERRDAHHSTALSAQFLPWHRRASIAERASSGTVSKRTVPTIVATTAPKRKACPSSAIVCKARNSSAAIVRADTPRRSPASFVETHASYPLPAIRNLARPDRLDQYPQTSRAKGAWRALTDIIKGLEEAARHPVHC
jgi:hypothetical protein